VAKANTMPKVPTTPVTGASSAPAVATQGAGAYAAVMVSTISGELHPLDVSGNPLVVTVANRPLLGVAMWSGVLYYTTQGSPVWMTSPEGGQATNVDASGLPATGPIAAGATGVYWSTATQMMRADDGGGSPTQLTKLSVAVSAITSDAFSIYWTDVGGGVYQLPSSNPSGVAPVSLNMGGSSATAYGIAVDSTGTVYFAQGAEVLRATFPFSGHPSPVVTGLVNPRGVAFDGQFLYVAEQGTSDAANPDGRILKIQP
jgi:hypothetical protein